MVLFECLWSELRSRCCAVHFLWVRSVCNGWLALAGWIFNRNVLIILQYGFITQKFAFLASWGLRPGPGLGLVSFY